MTPPESSDKTRQTYDEHAEVIAERFWGVALTDAWEAFLSSLPPKAHILDVGCGAGRDVFHFLEQGFNATGLDFSAGLLAEAAKHGEGDFIQADMRALPLAAEYFDGAWLCASLLHLQKEEAPGVIKAVHTRLKPGGILYISVKLGEGEEWEHREGLRFFSYFTTKEIEDVVTQAGFSLRRTWLKPTKKLTWINLLAEK
ncbi:MAG TPA: class I SAM-dependent methyltransferase [Anaerolineales bacterium]|nr:class I SAM-dependent methyltransferase [Anaerolineales bacterium]